MMSSMWRSAVGLAMLLGIAPSSSAQFASRTSSATSAYSAGQNVASALDSWRTLRQSNQYRFSDYAGFLIADPDWPDTSRMRVWAEKAMSPGENAATVIAFFADVKPQSGNGWARLADAYASQGRMAEALDAARQAWRSADLSATDEQAIWARYGASFTRGDDDQRIDSLLFAKKTDDAARFLPSASSGRQMAFAARVAMQEDSADADTRYGAVVGQVTSDAGLMLDRARYLLSGNREALARQLFAREHNFTYKPADPERFFAMQIALAGSAIDDHDWRTAYDIASGIDDIFPSGMLIANQRAALRDNYTTLAWMAGTVALDRTNEPLSAIAMFDRYAQGGKSLQVQTKGNYWAGRAALAAGRVTEANNYFSRAAVYPDLFYGQLALERLGRSVAAPPSALTQYVTTQVQRDDFGRRPLVEAVRFLGQQDRPAEQALFIKALAQSLNNDAERNLAVEISSQIGRPDLAVWTARMARVKGSTYYIRQAYPTLHASVSGELWSLAHGICRQESSFDPHAVSHSGARGMMQLMTGTAREEAGKIGIGFDSDRLISDPAYNVMIGSAYFQRLLNNWGGNVPLAVAAYNAGSGNVHKWVERYGDPRGQVDVLKWIEAIPYDETRTYVQRVIENSVVYDSIRSNEPQQSAFHVSRYLGKRRPG